MAHIQLPDQLDYRQVPNRVSPVINQRKCNCCWAITTVGMLEGQQVARTGEPNLVPLSVQQLIDCTLDAAGCVSGGIFKAFKYLYDSKGIRDAAGYPFVQANNPGPRFPCKTLGRIVMEAPVMFFCRDWPLLEIKELFRSGPLAVSVNTHKTTFAMYTRGIMEYGKPCMEDD